MLVDKGWWAGRPVGRYTVDDGVKRRRTERFGWLEGGKRREVVCHTRKGGSQRRGR